MRTPGLVDRHSASRVLLVISLILWCVLGLRYQKYRETLVHISKSQLPEPWTYALQDIGPMERYLLDLPQPFFGLFRNSKKQLFEDILRRSFINLQPWIPSGNFDLWSIYDFPGPIDYPVKSDCLQKKRLFFP